MSTVNQQILKAAVIAILINLVVPYIARPCASKKEVRPPAGVQKLSYKGQVMHMLVHHKQVPVTSSLIIAVIVAVAMYTSTKI
jgi:hypothetical protein